MTPDDVTRYREFAEAILDERGYQYLNIHASMQDSRDGRRDRTAPRVARSIEHIETGRLE